jgi:hypothetical protein
MNSRALSQSIEDVMQQGLELLDGMDAENYSQPLGPPYSATVGKHYRHVIDHFVCLARGIREGVIDYDDRERNESLENSRDAARRATQYLLGSLQLLTARDVDAPCSVAYSVGYRDATALSIQSTVAREISYCVSHAIHHFAIIRLVCAELGVRLPETFGVAPSTLKYRATHA